MQVDELLELLSPAGLRLLDSLPALTTESDVVRTVTRLRRAGNAPGLVAAVLTQARLRERARSKFGEFSERMLFTEAGLEQATRLAVSALHAGRYAAAGARRVADLGCGIGGDALALAALDLDVTGVESDEVTAAIASYNLAPFPNARVEHADASTFDLAGIDAVFLDPARRTAGHADTTRVFDPDGFSPSLDLAFGLARAIDVGVKLGPGLDRARIPPEAEAQWVSVDGSVVELGLWFGRLKREGVGRSALVLRGGAASELHAAGDSPDEEVGELGEFLYEPDGAVIRARLIGDLARSLGARMLSPGIAYFTADAGTPTPFAACFRVLDRLPSKEAELRRALRQRGIGVIEIKKRGVDVDPATLRGRLGLRGDGSATIVMTREHGRHCTLLVERVREGTASSGG